MKWACLVVEVAFKLLSDAEIAMNLQICTLYSNNRDDYLGYTIVQQQKREEVISYNPLIELEHIIALNISFTSFTKRYISLHTFHNKFNKSTQIIKDIQDTLQYAI